jgi:ABC-2 type transport system permease protein
MRKMIAVARKEFRQIWRDTRTLMTLLFVPAFFLLLYGYALNFDIRHVGLAVDDRDRTMESRALIAAFVNSGYFDLVATIDDAAAGSEKTRPTVAGRGPSDRLTTAFVERVLSDPPTTTRLMNRNDVRAVVVIPSGLGRAVRTAKPVAVQVLLNGDNANTATTVMGYALTIIRSESARYQPVSASPAPLVSAEPRVWYNPALRSTLFLVPGLIAYIAMITAVVSTALSIVREKERGTMEQVRMAPLDAASFVVGKTVPYFVVSLLSALGIIVVAMALFGMPMRGSWLLLLVALSLFLVGALGLGLLISSVADTQQVAFQAALLVSFLPTLMLSGFIFPISSMPRFLQLVTYAVPARYFLIALRGVVLKGVGLDAFGRELAALAAFAVVVLALASVRLHREWT